MVEEKRLDNLQDEIKLLKGELKNSLASVRDYLLNMELPSSEFSTILAALSGDNPNPQKLWPLMATSLTKHDMPEPNLDEEKPEEADGEPITNSRTKMKTCSTLKNPIKKGRLLKSYQMKTRWTIWWRKMNCCPKKRKLQRSCQKKLKSLKMRLQETEDEEYTGRRRLTPPEARAAIGGGTA